MFRKKNAPEEANNTEVKNVETVETVETVENGEEKKKKGGTSTIAFRGGSYSLLMTVIVLAILIVVNVFVGLLPTTLTSFDISSTQLYSVTSSTKVVVNNLEDDITIYWIVQADEEDSVIENLLNKYDSLSDHITVVKRNPDEYPTFVEQYTDEDAENNSLVVECGDRYRYVSYDDIYITSIDYTTYSYTYEFDGEGAITSAINYVTTEDLPKMYIIEGHGEADLTDDFSDQIEKENFETETLSLVSENEVPEDADCVLIYAPESDISEEEKDILSEYVEDGGKLMVIAGPVADADLENLYSLLEDYDVEVTEGIVVEEDASYYAFGYPYILLPEIESSDVTDSLIDSNYYAILPIAAGLVVDDDNDDVTTLLSTSDTAFSKVAGFDLTTYDKEDDDIDGPFALAVDIAAGSGEIIWIASSYLLDDTYNAYSSGANLDLTMNCLTYLAGETEGISIQSKSLSYSYLTISDSTSSMLQILMIFVFPIVFLVIGIVVLVRRRMKKHE